MEAATHGRVAGAQNTFNMQWVNFLDDWNPANRFRYLISEHLVVCAFVYQEKRLCVLIYEIPSSSNQKGKVGFTFVFASLVDHPVIWNNCDALICRVVFIWQCSFN